MKIVTVPAVREEAKYFCDKHPTTEAFSQLKLLSWYGSRFDSQAVEVHLCDQCIADMYEYFWSKYGVKPTDIPMV